MCQGDRSECRIECDGVSLVGGIRTTHARHELSRPQTFDNRDRKSASGLTHVNEKDEPILKVNWGAAKVQESARWDDVQRMREALDNKTPENPISRYVT